MIDTAAYLGLPYRAFGLTRDGLDCYGLARLVLGEQAGFWLPDYTGQYRHGRRGLRAIEAFIAQQQAVLAGREVPLDAARPLDLLIMRHARGARCHVTTVISADRCLDIEPGRNSWMPRFRALTHVSRIDRVVRLIPCDRAESTQNAPHS